MIRRELLDTLDLDSRREAFVALSTIFALGLNPLEQTMLKDSFMIGDESAPITDVAAELLDLRKRINMLEAMQELCRQCHEEITNA